MKKILKNILVALSVLALSGCDDFFITDPYDIINEDDYIKAQSEMYTGFIGIFTKMQAVADHAIYLTDTRADFLEPTVNTPVELREIYSYSDTRGNSFADPVKYYSVIIACNDYIHKMGEYKNNIGEAMDETASKHFTALISGALRIKAWTYLRLGQIYGEALYFDDPLIKLEDLSDSRTFQKMNLDQLLDQCLCLIDHGVYGIDGTYIMPWAEWINPSAPNDGSNLEWMINTPEYVCLRAEICLWKGTEYEWVRDRLLSYLDNVFVNGGSSNTYKLNAWTTGKYGDMFQTNNYFTAETVTSVVFDYNHNQTNQIYNVFSNTYPNSYWLRPSGSQIARYELTDKRKGSYFRQEQGDSVFAKFHGTFSKSQPYSSDVAIPLYRGHDLHYMLAEAENTLGNWDQAATIFNGGLTRRFPSAAISSDWDSRYQSWLSGSYANIGLRGVKEISYIMLPAPVALPPQDEWLYSDEEITEQERQRIYDMALLDEMLLDFVGEGRAYGMMIRMARKYNDYSIIADRVCPKYPEEMREEIRAKIMNGEYFVKWDLN